MIEQDFAERFLRETTLAAADMASLACQGARSHPGGMFVVTEAEAAATRAAFEQSGELAAAIEVRRLFPGITGNTRARECAQMIAGWQPPSPRRSAASPQHQTARTR